MRGSRFAKSPLRPVVRPGLLACVPAAVLALCAPVASAFRAAAPTCTSVGPTLIKSALGATVETTPSSSTSSYGGVTTLTCGYGGSVTISFISPATASGYNLLMTTLKHATIETTVTGLGTAAFSGTGSSTTSVYANGKSTTTTVATTNLWVYVAGKSIFEISVSKGSLTREKTLAKSMVRLV
jgi:hypothetical protein